VRSVDENLASMNVQKFSHVPTRSHVLKKTRWTVTKCR